MENSSGATNASRQQCIAASVAGRNSIWLTNNTASDYLYSTALLPMPHLTAML
jgi:hypothetical protein